MDNKNNFWLGLTSGVAVIALIAFIIMSVAYFKKGGSDTARDLNQNHSDQLALNNQPTNQPAQAPDLPVDIAVGQDDHIRGSNKAEVTIIEFSDFQCPYCSSFHSAMKQAVADYPDKVRWVYKHFPLDSIHPYARPAAEASECAAEQDKFWQYADQLFANQQNLSQQYFSELARQLNLNTALFNDCLSSGKYVDKVETDFRLGQQAGVTGTPGNFINGQKLNGAVPYSQLKAMIDSL